MKRTSKVGRLRSDPHLLYLCRVVLQFVNSLLKLQVFMLFFVQLDLKSAQLLLHQYTSVIKKAFHRI